MTVIGAIWDEVSAFKHCTVSLFRE